MSNLIYWVLMVLIVGASIGILAGTFITVRKNKNEENNRAGRGSSHRYDDEDDDYDEDDYEDERPRRRKAAPQAERQQAQRSAQQPRRNEKKQWKIILENLDSWEKHSFIFYDTVAIGRGSDIRTYEKYLSVSEDPRISKIHCAIMRRGDKLYLKDLESRNGTYLNGKKIDRPVVLQRDDVIGCGESRFEVLKILRERD